MTEPITFMPIGHVVSSVGEVIGENWGRVTSRIALLPEYQGGLEGLEQFSHAFVLTHLHKAEYQAENHLQKRPRGLAALPLVGVFARRAKERPSRIGLTVVKVVRVGTLDLEVQGLDAIEGTPVLDIKPYFPEYDSAANAAIPLWVEELMKGSG